ncbi:MAG: hypothetical protein AB8H86_05870 [Polyangiales bacterium]
MFSKNAPLALALMFAACADASPAVEGEAPASEPGVAAAPPEPGAASEQEAEAMPEPAVEPEEAAETRWTWAEMMLQTRGEARTLVARNSAEEGTIRFFSVEGFTSTVWLEIQEDPFRINAGGERFLDRPVVFREREYRVEHNCDGDWAPLVELDSHGQQVGDSPSASTVLERLGPECSVRWGIELQPGERPAANGEPASRIDSSINFE